MSPGGPEVSHGVSQGWGLGYPRGVPGGVPGVRPGMSPGGLEVSQWWDLGCPRGSRGVPGVGPGMSPVCPEVSKGWDLGYPQGKVHLVRGGVLAHTLLVMYDAIFLPFSFPFSLPLPPFHPTYLYPSLLYFPSLLPYLPDSLPS